MGALLNPRYPSRGFTLIELMVVLVMIAVIMAMAVLSIGDGGLQRRLQQESQRLATLIELGSDEAILRGQVVGILFDQSGYQFLFYEKESESWLPAEEESFRHRTLLNGATFELYLEGLIVTLGSEAEAMMAGQQSGGLTSSGLAKLNIGQQTQEQTAGPQPHILLLSSGERTPFEVIIHHEALQKPLHLEGDILGEVRHFAGDRVY